MLNKQVQELCDKFPAHLVAIRKSKGITQRELALASGLSRKVIGLYEGGHHEPTLGSIYKLAGGLGIHPALLLPSETEVHLLSDSDMSDFDFTLEILANAVDDTREVVRELLGEEKEEGEDE